MMDVFILTRNSHTHFYASKTVDYLCEEEYFHCVHVFFFKKSSHERRSVYFSECIFIQQRVRCRSQGGVCLYPPICVDKRNLEYVTFPCLDDPMGPIKVRRLTLFIFTESPSSSSFPCILFLVQQVTFYCFVF